jgi:hypothetical protein
MLHRCCFDYPAASGMSRKICTPYRLGDIGKIGPRMINMLLDL